MNLKANLFLIAMLLVNIQLFAQDTYTVSGTVTDAQNVPIPGVNVVVVNTTRGTQTDFDGNYSINVSNGESLQFSYIGYATQTVAITGPRTLNITLQEDASGDREIHVRNGVIEDCE